MLPDMNGFINFVPSKRKKLDGAVSSEHSELESARKRAELPLPRTAHSVVGSINSLSVMAPIQSSNAVGSSYHKSRRKHMIQLAGSNLSVPVTTSAVYSKVFIEANFNLRSLVEFGTANSVPNVNHDGTQQNIIRSGDSVPPEVLSWRKDQQTYLFPQDTRFIDKHHVNESLLKQTDMGKCWSIVEPRTGTTVEQLAKFGEARLLKWQSALHSLLRGFFDAVIPEFHIFGESTTSSVNKNSQSERWPRVAVSAVFYYVARSPMLSLSNGSTKVAASSDTMPTCLLIGVNKSMLHRLCKLGAAPYIVKDMGVEEDEVIRQLNSRGGKNHDVSTSTMGLQNITKAGETVILCGQRGVAIAAEVIQELSFSFLNSPTKAFVDVPILTAKKAFKHAVAVDMEACNVQCQYNFSATMAQSGGNNTTNSYDIATSVCDDEGLQTGKRPTHRIELSGKLDMHSINTMITALIALAKNSTQYETTPKTEQLHSKQRMKPMNSLFRAVFNIPDIYCSRNLPQVPKQETAASAPAENVAVPYLNHSRNIALVPKLINPMIVVTTSSISYAATSEEKKPNPSRIGIMNVGASTRSAELLNNTTACKIDDTIRNVKDHKILQSITQDAYTRVAQNLGQKITRSNDFQRRDEWIKKHSGIGSSAAKTSKKVAQHSNFFVIQLSADPTQLSQFSYAGKSTLSFRNDLKSCSSNATNNESDREALRAQTSTSSSSVNVAVLTPGDFIEELRWYSGSSDDDKRSSSIVGNMTGEKTPKRNSSAYNSSNITNSDVNPIKHTNVDTQRQDTSNFSATANYKDVQPQSRQTLDIIAYTQPALKLIKYTNDNLTLGVQLV